MDAVEIVVRFAGTLLHVARLSHGGRFRIGTAPDVDLPVDIAPLTSFSLVEGHVVRCPAGVPAVIYTTDRAITVTESTLALERGARVDIAFGRVMLSITRTAAARAPLPRPRASFRTHVFAVVSLALHLAGVFVAMQLADAEPVTIPVFREPVARPPTQLVQLPTEKQKARMRQRAKQRIALAAVKAAVEEDTPRGRAVAEVRKHGMFGSLTPQRMRALVGTKNLAKELVDLRREDLYDEDAANAKLFGGSSGRFDPTKDPAFDSVKTGRYATNAHSGAAFDLAAAERVRVAMCGAACEVAGALDRDVVHRLFAQRTVAIVACYERHAAATADVVLTFEIDRGAAKRLTAAGPSELGTCIAKVARGIRFPADAQLTRVTYPLAFTRG